MNETNHNRPETEYPPTLSDFENIQRYITILEAELHNGVDNIDETTAEITDYSELLTQRAMWLEIDGFDRQARTSLELGQLLLSSLDFQ